MTGKSARFTSTLEPAVEYIKAALSGGPRVAGEVKAEMHRLGHSDSTINKATKSLGVRFRREGQNWVWTMGGFGSVSEPSKPVTHMVIDSDGLVRPPNQDLIAGDLRDDVTVHIGEGRTGIIGDAHVPFHHVTADGDGAYMTALTCLRNADIQTLLINGDYIDFHAISRHERDISKRDLAWEIEAARSMLRHLRNWFGSDVRIIYREGNHEERWWKYLAADAKSDTASLMSAIAKADGFDVGDLGALRFADLPTVLKLADLGIEWVDQRCKMTIGKLNADHGHEFYGSGGVMPGRAYMLKAMDNIIVNHVHKTSEFYMKRPHDHAMIGGFSVGCLCDLNPWWFPRNNWNHGYAYVDVDATGRFEVTNKIIMGAQ